MGREVVDERSPRQHDGETAKPTIALVQRVSEASVRVDGAVVGQIGAGLLVLVCAEPLTPRPMPTGWWTSCSSCVFSDVAGKMNRSVVDGQGGLLVVSQFTLAADVAGGNRPSFSGAAPAEQGQRLYEAVLAVRPSSPSDRPGWCVRGRHAGLAGQRRAGDDPAAAELTVR